MLLAKNIYDPDSDTDYLVLHLICLSYNFNYSGCSYQTISSWNLSTPGVNIWLQLSYTLFSAFALKAKRFAFAGFLYVLFFLHGFCEISVNSEQKNILQTITHLIQNTVLGIQFRSVKYTVVTLKYPKIWSNIYTRFRS